MYEVYQRLLDENGLKNADVARATGISNMTLSDWKRGKSVPKSDKMRKIAEYLNVSVDYLMTGTEKGYSEEDALFDAHISEDVELKEAIKKYYTLDEKARKYILEGIDLLWIANKTDTK